VQLADENVAAEVKEKPGFDFRILLVGLVLFLVAMGASYLVMKSLIAPLVPESNKKEEVQLLSGNLIEIGDFTTNINSTGGTRFLKVSVTVEVNAEDKKAVEKLTKLMPIIQDSVLGVLAKQNVADLDPHNHGNLKDAIRQDINAKVGGNLVTNVYFTDFKMQ
jgi:flagellar FliL protein